jgi:hypothetical protein
MNASEFRIGNYFYPTSKGSGIKLPIHTAHKVYSINPFKVQSCFIEDNFAQVEKMFEIENFDIVGIPLTKEWLMKFGFEKWGYIQVNEHESYERYVLHSVIDGSSNFEVHIISSNYGGIEEKEICYSIDNDERQWVKHTDSVHNLQNAFYLALGEELTHE